MTQVRSFPNWVRNLYDREKWRWCADWLVVAIAAALPWSTSMSVVLIGLWGIAFLGMRDFALTFKEWTRPAGGLPVALWMLAIVGMLWATVPWDERIDGLSTYHRLFAIPVLFVQFRQSHRAQYVLIAFVASCTLMLMVSWALALLPDLPWRGHKPDFPGIPVKDYIAQAQAFTLCVFGLSVAAARAWNFARYRLAFGLGTLALLFLSNILYIAPSRTALITIPILLLLLAFARLGWKGLAGATVLATTLALLAWHTSPALQRRVTLLEQEIRDYDPSGPATSVGERLQFWSKSIAFIADAPVLGHGTGSIRDQFRRAAYGETGIAAEVAAHPHNQIFAVAIQLGLFGTVVLIAMWVAHLLLFRGPEWPAVIGLAVVVQNVIGSMFNSLLFDFTPGWIYVFGVGVLGSMTMRRPVLRSSSASSGPT